MSHEGLLQGYESYSVRTEDGYIVTLFRLISKTGVREQERLLNEVGGEPKPAVFLLHGVASSGLQWMLNYPGKDLPHLLMDEGFDVWIGNMRGCEFSQDHTTLNTDSREYWDFGMEEIGLYDIPAMIDRILNITGNKKLYYVGTSLGATLLFITMSGKPEYNEKIKMYFSLGPLVYSQHQTGLGFYTIVPGGHFLSSFVSYYKRKSGDISALDLGHLASRVCPSFMKLTAEKIGFYIFKKITGTFGAFGDPDEFDEERRSMILKFGTSTTSAKVPCQLCQIIYSKQFRSFDYGKSANLKVYGEREPKPYDLSKLTCPAVFFSGEMDTMCTVKDIEKLSQAVPNLIENIVIPKLSHVNFVIGKDTDTLVYRPIVKLLKDNERGSIKTPYPKN